MQAHLQKLKHTSRGKLIPAGAKTKAYQQGQTGGRWGLS